MTKTLRIALIIVEASSIPLLLLTMLYILSGYQMLYPHIYLLPSAKMIHTDKILRMLFVTLAYLHSAAGIIIMCERRLRKGLVRHAIELTVIVVLTIIFGLTLLLDLGLLRKG